MATTLATTLGIALRADHRSALDLVTVRGDLVLNISDSLASGTGVDQADRIWHDTGNLAGTTLDIDLAGALTDAFGATVTFVKVKAIIIHNQTTGTGKLLAVGGAVATQFVNWVAHSSDIVNIGPGGILVLWSPVDGYAVGAGASDFLRLNSVANTIDYDIVIIGTSA